MNTMNGKSGESVSLWTATDSAPLELRALSEDLEADVCIVGGGLAGLTTAYLLMQEGLRVCVLEDSELCSGQSGRTTAHFSTALDDRLYRLEKYHGYNGVRLAVASHAAAIAKVKEIVAREAIDCDLETLDGYLFTPEVDEDGKEYASNDPNRTAILEQELLAAQRAGLSDVELVDVAPVSFFDMGPCLRFPNQLQLHPVKYAKALARLILAGGGRIFTHTHVVHVEGGDEAFVATKNGGKVLCQAIVVATNTPINDLFAIHTKQAPYRTYAMAFRIPKQSVVKALYWDTLDPYHYVRLQSDAIGDLLIVGGEDHKTGQEPDPEKHFANLENWTRARFSMAQEIVNRWSGQIMETIDGLAFLGHNPADRDNVYVITGDSGDGMTHGTIGAMLIADQIMDRKNPWESLYNPSRFIARSTVDYLVENANVAAQYGEWLAAKPRPDLQSLPTDQGVVFRDGLKMVAVYKDERGNLESMSAVCPHLAGIVSWNASEKSWDCPCHGSRFNCHGKVIEGPAFRDLEPIPLVEITPPAGQSVPLDPEIAASQPYIPPLLPW